MTGAAARVAAPQSAPPCHASVGAGGALLSIRGMTRTRRACNLHPALRDWLSLASMRTGKAVRLGEALQDAALH
jgi:hypothetical protein